MSLSYHIEHLAWKQRVNQEMSRATAFPRPASGLSSSINFQDSYNASLAKSHSQMIPELPKQSTLNLAYTFGGFTPARYAFKDPKESSYSVYHEDAPTVQTGEVRPQSRLKSVGVNTRSGVLPSRGKSGGRPKTAGSPQKRYIQELQTLVNEEKRKREAIERKLKHLRAK